MRTPILAACMALLAASPALSADVTLANGRTFATPTAVPGCTAPTVTAPAKGLATHAMTCTIAVDGKPKSAIVHITVFDPNRKTNWDFFRNLLDNYGKLDQLNDPRMGPKPRVIQTGGAKGIFLCYAMDDVANRSGGEVCALEGEPGVRVTLLVVTTDAYSGARIMDEVLKASVLR